MTTDKNNEAFGAAAGNDALLLTTKGSGSFNADIVDYRTAKPEQKAQMDALISKLEAALAANDYTVVTNFDKAPSDKLGNTSEKILREVQNANSFLGSFKAFGEKVANFDFEGVGKMARDYSETIQRKLQLAGIKSPVVRAIKSIALWLSGLGSKQTTGDQLRHEIDKSILEFGEVIAELEEAKDKIPGVAKNLDVQEDARIEAYSEYGLYIGSALEVFRRLKEEQIPALEAKAQETGSMLDANEVRAKKLGMTVLNKKLTSMDTFHKSCLVQLETIGELKGALSMCELNINTHLTTGRNEWLAFLSESTSAATLSEIAEADQKAGEFGDKIFEQAQSLSDLTTQMSRACFEHGSLDAALVAKFLNQKAAGVIEGIQFIDQVNARFEQKRADLDAAAENLLRAKAQASASDYAETAKQEVRLLTHQPEEKLDVQPVPVKQPVPRNDK